MKKREEGASSTAASQKCDANPASLCPCGRDDRLQGEFTPWGMRGRLNVGTDSDCDAGNLSVLNNVIIQTAAKTLTLKMVAAAVNDIAKIAPPRSWPKEKKDRFLALPYDLQVYVAARAEQQGLAVRRAQNDKANPRQR